VPAKDSRESAISSYTLQLMAISRNLFHKSGVQKPSSTLLQCQSLPNSSLRAVRSEYPAYIVVAFIYKQGGEAIRSQSAALHSTGNISAEDSGQPRTKAATTAHVEL
jgi:hypothetical protein